MSVLLVTFATKPYYFSQYKLGRTALKLGVDKVFLLNQNDFRKSAYYKLHESISKQIRGAGYWLWKPYYINTFLDNLGDNDVLIYCDAGLQIISNLKPLIETVRKSDTGIMLFENYQGSAFFNKSISIEPNYVGIYEELNKNKYWVKRDVFEAIDAVEKHNLESFQVDASFLLVRKTPFSIAFVNEWKRYCENQQLLTDLPNLSGYVENENFFGHLHDQSILSVLASKFNLELFRSPSQFGNHFKLAPFRIKGEYLLLPYSNRPKLNSMYGTILLHSRERVVPFRERIKHFLLLELKLVYANLCRIRFRYKTRFN